jgi:hypothetical protein
VRPLFTGALVALSITACGTIRNTTPEQPPVSPAIEVSEQQQPEHPPADPARPDEPIEGAPESGATEPVPDDRCPIPGQDDCPPDRGAEAMAVPQCPDPPELVAAVSGVHGCPERL